MDAPRFPAFFFHLFHAAEIKPHAPQGFRIGDAGLPILVQLLLAMKAQFIV